MKAAVYRGPERVDVEEVPYPSLPPDGLILKVDACGICGSDLRTFRHGMRANLDFQILGHEIAGTVIDVGGDVHDYRPGDRLAVAADVHCHDCYYCRRALYNHCENWKLLGTHLPGGMAEYMQMPFEILRRGIVHRIPDGLPATHAALAEPAASVVAGLSQSGVEPGEVIAIIGDGPIGALHVQVARARGARVIWIGLVAERLQMGEALGAWKVIDGSAAHVVTSVRDLTDGLGADVTVVACPSKEAQDQAVRMVKKRGRVVLFGGLPKNDPITHLDSNIIHYSELRLIGAFSYHPSFHQVALDLIARGLIDGNRLITSVFPLDRVRDAFGALLAASPTELKIMITP